MEETSDAVNPPNEPPVDPPVDPPMKLCGIVVASVDGDRLMEKLVALDLSGPKSRSTGGFLCRGNNTVLRAVPAGEVSKLVAMLHRESPVRTETVPSHELPFSEEPELPPAAGTVRVSGAVMFVLNIDRFEQS